MRWIKPGLRNTISALLSSEARHESPEMLEPIRLAMLAILGKDGALKNPAFHHRLMYLHDAHALWYARSDLVAVLSQMHGEEQAVTMVQDISPMFKGLLPKGLMSACNAQRSGF